MAHDFSPGALIGAANRIAVTGAGISENAAGRLIFPRDEYEDFKREARLIAEEAKKFGLIAAEAAANRLLDVLARADLTDERFAIFSALDQWRFKSACQSTATSIRDELRGRVAVAIDSAAARYYKPEAPLFGPAVAEKFTGTLEDIEDAGKCLALGQKTACVFHLMRVVEAAVRRLGDALGVTIVDKNNVDLEWGKILANMKASVEAMPPGEKRNAWSEALTLLYHVKQTWRNDTMHPKATYTPDQAKEVFEAVRAFMGRLAELISP